MVDADGNSLIDLGSGIAVVTSATRARGRRRVAAQAAAFTHTCFMITPYEGYVAVVRAAQPADARRPREAPALFNSGAEAVENAVKIARHATGRSAVVVLDHAYHGRTNLTMAMTAKSMPYKAGFGPFAPEVYRVPMAYPFRWPGGADRRPRPRRGPSTTSEPGRRQPTWPASWSSRSRARAGSSSRPPGYLPALVEFCRENGIVFVADEIQTGFGRTGALVRQRARGHRPRPGHHGQGHRRRPAARRRHRPGRAHGRRPRRRAGRHLRRQPGGLRRRARHHRR